TSKEKKQRDDNRLPKEDVSQQDEPKQPGGKPFRDPLPDPGPLGKPDPKPMKQERLALLPIPAQSVKAGESVKVTVNIRREDCKGDVRIELVPVNPSSQIKGVFIVPADADHLDLSLNLAENAVVGLEQVRVNASLGGLTDSKILEIRIDKPVATV